MKNIFKYILLLLPILLIWSCQDDDDLVIANATTAPIVLEAENNMVDLDPNYKNNPGLTLVWSHADYDVQAIPQYTVWFSLDNFDTERQVFNTTNRTKTWTVEQINILVQDLGMAPSEIGTLYVKIKSALGDQGQLGMESNVVSFDMEPYSTYSFKDFYLVGNATSAGWNPGNDNQALFRNPNNENEFSFTGYFDSTDPGNIEEGRFKLVEVLGEWQPQWGDARPEGDDTHTMSGNVAGNPATQSNDPGRFGVPSSGYYTFDINFSTLTYNITPYDASGATIYNRVGFIGDATPTGWDGDTAMMRNSEFDPHNWYMQNVELGNGELKFRANEDWDVSWGNTTPYSGVGQLGGENIPVSAGVYNIWFNDLTGEYQLIPQD